MDLKRLTGTREQVTHINRSLLSLMLVAILSLGSLYFASSAHRESEQQWLLTEASKYENVLQTEIQHLIDLIYRSADQTFSPDTPAVANSFPWVRSIGMIRNQKDLDNQTKHQLLTLSLSEVSRSLGGQITFAMVGDSEVLLVLSKAGQQHTIQAIFSADKLFNFVNDQVNTENLDVDINVTLLAGALSHPDTSAPIQFGLPGLKFEALLSEAEQSDHMPSNVWPLTLVLIAALWMIWSLLFFERRKRARHLELIEEQKERIESQTGRSALAEIASTIGHEINQPIAAIESLSDTACLLIERDRASDATNKLREIQREATRVGQIVHTIRRLSSTGQLQPERIDLATVVAELEPLAQIICKDAALSFRKGRSNKPAWISADRTSIEQVLLNLISNAHECFRDKDNAGRGSNQVKVSVARTDQDVTVTVTDNGPGIDPSVRDHIFQSLISTKPDGVGLGLSLSRSIIEKHHGQLSLTKTDASGTTFELRLPLLDD